MSAVRMLRGMLVTGSISALLAGWGLSAVVTSGSIPGADGTFTGCYDSGGALKLFPSGTTTCPKGWAGPVSWNQKGIKGEPGPAGPAGVAGPKGDPGVPGTSLTSIEALNGVQCGQGAARGTVKVAVAGTGAINLSCALDAHAGLPLTINEVGMESLAFMQFIELHFGGTGVANVAGWQVVHRGSGSADEQVLVTFPAGTLAQPEGFILLAPAGPGGILLGDYAYPSDVVLNPDGGGLQIRDAEGDAIDSFGWGTGAGSGFVEGTALAEASRTSNGRYPDGHDSNDNSADFCIEQQATRKAPNTPCR